MENFNYISKNVFFQGKHNIEPFCFIGKNKTYNDPSEEEKLIFGKNILIRSHAVIYLGSTIGDDFQTGHNILIRENCKIGNKVSIGSGTIIEHSVIIENNVRVHSKAFIPEFSILKEGCWVGPNVILTNAKYPRSTNIKKNLIGPIIEEGAIIGANVTILPGIIIGSKALIGAGSVITKNIPANAVVVGNPGKIIRNIYDIKGKY